MQNVLVNVREMDAYISVIDENGCIRDMVMSYDNEYLSIYTSMWGYTSAKEAAAAYKRTMASLIPETLGISSIDYEEEVDYIINSVMPAVEKRLNVLWSE